MFKELFTLNESDMYVVVDDSILPNAIQNDGSTWGVSNISEFIKSLEDSKKFKKYAMSKKDAQKLAKKGDPKFGTFKIVKI